VSGHPRLRYLAGAKERNIRMARWAVSSVTASGVHLAVHPGGYIHRNISGALARSGVDRSMASLQCASVRSYRGIEIQHSNPSACPNAEPPHHDLLPFSRYTS
jgi:hypothetical protein